MIKKCQTKGQLQGDGLWAEAHSGIEKIFRSVLFRSVFLDQFC